MSDNINTIQNTTGTAAENETPVFYGVKDIARLLGCSIPTARDVMRRKDFPLIVSGKKWLVLKSAFISWASVKRA